MAGLKERDSKTIWHPYTPMKIWPEAIGIVSGNGAVLTDEHNNEYIDAISSWWVNLHGHAHPYIRCKINAQLKSLSHCIFAGFTHEPAVSLSERLLNLLPGHLSRIFYTDNGSTAVEAAIKMALQYWKNKKAERNRIVVLEHSYHGDSFGAMSVSGRGLFTKPFEDKLFEVDVIPFPIPGREQASVERLKYFLRKGNIAAFIVEPLVLGASGMLMYEKTVLDAWFGLCEQHEAIIIADEIMTGFGRTGELFACNGLNNGPDIVCLSKGLTGGTMPLGVVACKDWIFEAFSSDDRDKSFHHGHSFTANPIACTAALASLDLLLRDSCAVDRDRIGHLHTSFLQQIESSSVELKAIRHKGTILAIELYPSQANGYHSHKRDLIYRYFIDRGILIRPIGNIIYLIPPYCISNQQLTYIYDAISELLQVGFV
jgi:adenosylmethionine-8-amino-7-oxononanoate aminotransferase